MYRVLFVLTVLLFGAAAVVVPLATAGEPVQPAGNMPQIIVFDEDNFLRDHTHIGGDMRDLSEWDNRISTMIILLGSWEFFDNDHFEGTKMATLGPGTYLRVTDKGIKDNSISSIRLASPTAALAQWCRAVMGCGAM